MKLSLKSTLFEIESNKIHNMLLEQEEASSEEEKNEESESEEVSPYSNIFTLSSADINKAAKKLSTVLNPKMKSSSVSSAMKDFKNASEKAFKEKKQSIIDKLEKDYLNIPNLGNLKKQSIEKLSNFNIPAGKSGVDNLIISSPEMVVGQPMKKSVSSKDIEVYDGVQLFLFVLMEKEGNQRIAGTEVNGKKYFYLFAAPPLGVPIGKRKPDSQEDFESDEILQLHSKMYGLDLDKNENTHVKYESIAYFLIECPPEKDKLSWEDWNRFKTALKNKNVQYISKVYDRGGRLKGKSVDDEESKEKETSNESFSNVYSKSLNELLFIDDLLLQEFASTQGSNWRGVQDDGTGYYPFLLPDSDNIIGRASRLGRGANLWQDPYLDVWSDFIKTKYKQAGDITDEMRNDPKNVDWNNVVIKTGDITGNFRKDVFHIQKQMKKISEDQVKEEDKLAGPKEMAAEAGGLYVAYSFLTASILPTTGVGLIQAGAVNGASAIFGTAGMPFFAGVAGPLVVSLGLPIAFIIGSKLASGFTKQLGNQFTKWKETIWDTNLKNKFTLIPTELRESCELFIDYAAEHKSKRERVDWDVSMRDRMPSGSGSAGMDAAAWNDMDQKVPTPDAFQLTREGKRKVKLLEYVNIYSKPDEKLLKVEYDELENLMAGLGLFCFRSGTQNDFLYKRGISILETNVKGLFKAYFGIDLVRKQKIEKEQTASDEKLENSLEGGRVKNFWEVLKEVKKKFSNIKYSTEDSESNKGQAARFMYAIHVAENSSVFKHRIKLLIELYLKQDKELENCITDENAYGTNKKLKDAILIRLGAYKDERDQEDEDVKNPKQPQQPQQQQSSGQSGNKLDKKEVDRLCEKTCDVSILDAVCKAVANLSLFQKSPWVNDIDVSGIATQSSEKDLYALGASDLNKRLIFGIYFLEKTGSSGQSIQYDKIIEDFIKTNPTNEGDDTKNLENILEYIADNIVNQLNTFSPEILNNFNTSKKLAIAESKALLIAAIGNGSPESLQALHFQNLLNKYVSIIPNEIPSAYSGSYATTNLNFQFFVDNLEESFIYRRGLSLLLN